MIVDYRLTEIVAQFLGPGAPSHDVRARKGGRLADQRVRARRRWLQTVEQAALSGALILASAVDWFFSH
jgi:hypothetical protein